MIGELQVELEPGRGPARASAGPRALTVAFSGRSPVNLTGTLSLQSVACLSPAAARRRPGLQGVCAGFLIIMIIQVSHES